MKRLFICVLLYSVCLGLIACGDKTSSTTTTTPGTATTVLSKVGFDLPSEISAVPTTAQGSSSKPGLLSKVFSLSAATDPTTDFSKATTVRHVSEHALEQTQIIGEILAMLAQTHYADEANINNGPYLALVASEGEEEGNVVKSIVPWVVDSKILLEGDKQINRVQAWIEETDNGTPMPIKAEFKIYSAATKKGDGSYKNYGVWTVNAKISDQGNFTFAADIGVGPTGATTIKIHEAFQNGEVKVILNRTDTEGFGKVAFPDFESCTSDSCVPAATTATYAYNPTHLGIKKGGNPPVFKDRVNFTEWTHRYGLFDGITGEDMLRTKSFGFPVEFTSNNIQRHGFYGAWQGRHNLWADGTDVPSGTVVTRQRDGSGTNTTLETYTVSQVFRGILTKRSLVLASVNDLLNLPVETFVDRNMLLRHNGTKFIDCRNIVFFPSPTCGNGSSDFTDFASLVMDPKDEFGRRVDIGGTRLGTFERVDYVYLLAGPAGPGFYEATFNPASGKRVPTSTKLVPEDGTELFVHIGGRVYIEYTAAGWVEKTLLSFDQRTWTPKFDDSKDTSFTPELGREYYINTRGANFVMERTDTGIYDVRIEIQEAANPKNAASLIPPGTELKPEWSDTGGSTFEFITDPANAKFLKLVYKTVGKLDSGAVVGAVVEKGMWGLVATIGGVSVRFNWEFPQGDQHWGKQQFLIQDGDYKILDNPIAFKPTILKNRADEVKTLSLQFDGWMHGLPDLFFDLRQNDFRLTPDIANKVINIPEGTMLEDAAVSGKTYLVKPLIISQFFSEVPDPGTLSLALAVGIDLSTVPNFVEHNMGATPKATLKYIEGVKVP